VAHLLAEARVGNLEEKKEKVNGFLPKASLGTGTPWGYAYRLIHGRIFRRGLKGGAAPSEGTQ